MYDVKWSPTHPALFASVDGGAKFDLWNLNADTEVSAVVHRHLFYIGISCTSGLVEEVLNSFEGTPKFFIVYNDLFTLLVQCRRPPRKRFPFPHRTK